MTECSRRGAPGIIVPESSERDAKRPIAGSRVLITGGTGSFGHRVARFLEGMHPREIRIFSRDEKKQWEMRRRRPDYRYFLGDVRERESMGDAFRGVDYVFHAAALKQVPSCEMYPIEAMRTNVLGAINVCSAARSAGVRVVVALSTDKAVKPINAMGTTKALMEKIVCAQNQFEDATVYCCVRYGNVMGTRGSVIPLFRHLIKEGRPLTITDPAMTRFMMTLDDSVELVARAIEDASGGEIFVRKAPASKIADLTLAIAKRYSTRGDMHPIERVGARPGEKVHEVLVNEYELRRATEDEGYFVIRPEYRSAPSSARLTTVPFGTEYTSANTRQLTTYAEISQMLDVMGQIEEYD